MAPGGRDRPLRVHLVHQGFGDYVTGLVGGLEALGHEAVDLAVTTFISGPSPRTRLQRSVPGDPGSGPALTHETVVVPRFRDPRSAIRSRREVSRALSQPADVVHWQACGNPWVDLAFLRSLPQEGQGGGPASVVTVHDMQPHPGDSTVLPGTFPIIRRLVRRADRIVVHASHIRHQAIAAGARPDRVSIEAHGELGTRYVPPDRLPLPPADEPTVLFFGRAEGYKGLDVAVAAMPMVVAAVPGARLVVAGTGRSLDRIFPPDRPLPRWCELHRGQVPDDEVAELFRRAAVVVLPYREASQSGVAALAAGLGRPVVASQVAGLDEMVGHGRTGLLVAPGSPEALSRALIEVLSDRELAADLGRGAFAWAETRLSWLAIAENLLDLYHDAVHRVNSGTQPASKRGRRAWRGWRS